VKPVMKWYKTRSPFLLLSGLLFFTACAGMPHIIAVDTAVIPKTIKACETVFPKGKWQFAHVIEATLPGGRKSQLIGVTEVSSNPGRIHAVMMTIEGLVLFDGLEDGKLTINRGVAPFDSRAFAKGLMEDIRLIFLEPDGEPMGVGITENGFDICRYPVSDDSVIDVMVRPDRMFEIRKYGNEQLFRKVVAELNPGSIPEKIAFTAYEPASYRLNLRLISAEKISDE
jgi:hypothetical protein